MATGKRPCKAKSLVATTLYKYRVRQLREARSRCRASARIARATYYGGPTDGSSGTMGYRGDNLNVHWQSYAELSNSGLDFAALGGLPYGYKLWIHVASRSQWARKRDVGRGGPRGPKIDLWHRLAADLHFKDGLVRLTRRPCRKVF